MMMHTFTVIAGVLAASAPAQPAPPADVLVGVNYFAGWWEPLPNKWHDATGEDWRPRYPERVPTLGEYNTQETMDREIIAAASHGVDFFAILWYYNPPGTEAEPNARFLERGVTNFIASPENHRMRFMLEFCNHPPFEVATDEDWTRCVELWTSWIQHPQYLRIDGKPVFKVHGFHHFYTQNGRDPAFCKKRLDQLRQSVRDAGAGEMLIGCGVGEHDVIAEGHPAVSLFDFTAVYMGVPPLEQRSEDYPYKTLLDRAQVSWKTHGGDAIPHMPYLPAGWSPRPWHDPRPSFAFPTRGEWDGALSDIKAALTTTSILGLPGQKAFTIYAWNEFGEGGIVAPTQGEGTMKLEGIQANFHP
ncbi:MAG TPA: hypothetical protein PLD73_09275 [Candidatus Hydrogenedentes bacterium]|jgi:hypothetical protein|nr:hypothetical protein [Candidatus Hydrogenedentota bacterium]